MKPDMRRSVDQPEFADSEGGQAVQCGPDFRIKRGADLHSRHQDLCPQSASAAAAEHQWQQRRCPLKLRQPARWTVVWPRIKLAQVLCICPAQDSRQRRQKVCRDLVSGVIVHARQREGRAMAATVPGCPASIPSATSAVLSAWPTAGSTCGSVRQLAIFDSECISRTHLMGTAIFHAALPRNHLKSCNLNNHQDSTFCTNSFCRWREPPGWPAVCTAGGCSRGAAVLHCRTEMVSCRLPLARRRSRISNTPCRATAVAVPMQADRRIRAGSEMETCAQSHARGADLAADTMNVRAQKPACSSLVGRSLGIVFRQSSQTTIWISSPQEVFIPHATDCFECSGCLHCLWSAMLLA